MKIAVLGYGTVGSGVVEVLEVNRDLITRRAGREIDVKYVLDLRDFPGQKIQEKIASRVQHYRRIMGVSVGRITIRNQKSRWGSCSSRGNLSFHCLLSRMPETVFNYVVVHELCHRKHMNHSAAFWDEVAAILPDYKASRDWLKREGGALLCRIPAL